LLIVAVVAALLRGAFAESDDVTISYHAFKQLVEGDQVEKVQFTSPYTLTGKARSPVADEQGRKSEEFSVNMYGLPKDDSLTKLLDEHKVDYRAAAKPNEWGMALLWMLPTLVLFGLLTFLLFRRMGPGGSAMTFGRSKHKLYAQEDLHVTFDDVAGIDEAVAELREVVDFLKTPEKYQAIGGRIPKGVLLVGPPGTGKTLLARAVAGEAGVAFFGLTGSDFVEMFVGVGAARVRDLFAQAEQRAPCIIFIDELDALGKTRGGGYVGGHDEREQTLNQLLAEMDGFDSNRGVIIMAATNRPEILDAALLRPGRFDRTVVVDRPDVIGREAILKVHVRNVKVAEDLDLREVAALTPGFVGADLANLVNEAALLAARQGFPHVAKHHLEEAIERGVAGLERKQRVMMPEEKRRIAYHECGHAIVAYLLPGSDPVHKISIIPRGVGALGYTLQRPLDDRYLATQTELEGRICTLLGGITAEELVFKEVSTGAQNDLDRVTRLARSMVTEYGMSPRLGRLNYRDSEHSQFLGASAGVAREYSEETAREIDLEARRIVDASQKLVREILVEQREALERLSELLLEKEVLDAHEFREVMEATSPRLVPGTSTVERKVLDAPSAAPGSPAEETG
jgi:cell division protease FtsH